MESKLKCPFCGDELDWCLSCPLPTMSCPNHNCKAYDFLMPKNCWCELIETKQDLKIALKMLEDIASGQIIEHSVFGHESDNKIAIARKALKQIEHKGV